MVSEFQVWIFSLRMTHSSSLRGHLRPWKSAELSKCHLEECGWTPVPHHCLSLIQPVDTWPFTSRVRLCYGPSKSPRLLSHQLTRIIKHPVDKQDGTVFFFVFFFPWKSSFQKNRFFLVVLCFWFFFYLMLWTGSLSLSVHKEFPDSFYFLAFFIKLIFKFVFSGRIIALRCCTGFCCETRWINYKYTYIPSLWGHPLTPQNTNFIW